MRSALLTIIAIVIAVGQSNAQAAGNAIDFDGVDDYVPAPSPTGLPDGDSPRTMEIWFKTDKNLATDTESGLVHFGTSSSSHMYGLITSGNAPGKLYFLGHSFDLAGVTPLSVGVRYHGAVTYDGSVFRLYLNGNLEASATAPLTTIINSTGLTIGRRSDGSYRDGQLDEVRVWDHARTQIEIQAT